MDITELTKWVVNRGDDLYSIDKQVQFKKKLDEYFKAINYTRCCESDSEQLCEKYVPYFGIGKFGWEVKYCKNCKKKH